MKRYEAVFVVAWVILLFACRAAAAEETSPQDKEINILRAQLRAGGTADRMAAARSLQKIKTDAAFTALLEGLKDRNEDVLQTVISAVAAFETTEAVEALSKTFKDCSNNTKLHIIGQLKKYRDRGEVDLFLRALQDRDDNVRLEALKQLNERRESQGVVDALLKIMEGTDCRMKEEIVGHVPLRTEDPRELKILSNGLKNKYDTVQIRALDRLLSMEIDPDVKLEMALTAKSNLSIVQDKVIDVLVLIRTEKAVDALLKMQRTLMDKALSQKICGALGMIGGEYAANGLAAYIYHSDVDIRSAAIQALGNIQNETSKTALKKALRDPDPGIQKAAIQGLAKFKSPDLVNDIVRTLKSRSPFDMYVAVINALEPIKDPQATAALIRIAESSSLTVSAEAIKALGKTRQPEAVRPITLLIKRNISSRDGDAPMFLRFAMGALVEIGGPETEEAMIFLAGSTFGELRPDALKQLGNFSSAGATRVLIKALSDPDAAVRTAALKAISQSLPPQAVDYVGKMLGDRSQEVQLAAIEALESYALPQTASLLTRNYNDEGCYRAAVQALARINSKDSREFLFKALLHKDPKVRVNALTGLGLPWARGDISVGDKLAEFLKDEKERRQRDAAIAALGNNGTEDAVKNLEELCNSAVIPDAEAATVAMGRTGSDRAADILLNLLETARYAVKMKAIAALGDMGDEKTVPPLIKLLDNQDVNIRAAAVGALGKFNTEDAKKALIKALSDRSTRVTNPAIQLLARYREDAEVLKAVIKLMDDKVARARKEAAELLPLYASHDAVPPLAAHMRDDPDKDVKAACLQALRRLLNRDLGENADDWLNWWTVERGRPVGELINAGFIDKGYNPANASKSGLVEEYLRALGDGNDYIRYNAASRLREITGQNFGHSDAKGWKEWWGKNKAGFS